MNSSKKQKGQAIVGVVLAGIITMLGSVVTAKITASSEIKDQINQIEISTNDKISDVRQTAAVTSSKVSTIDESIATLNSKMDVLLEANGYTRAQIEQINRQIK